MANILFNYGNAPEGAGWTSVQVKNLEEIVESDDIAGMNPNQAVPSPYARFEVARRAFENFKKNKQDERDLKTVSDILDVLQVLFEDKEQFKTDRLHLPSISDHLIELGNRKADNRHLKIYGEALQDYLARESFMDMKGSKDKDAFYIFSKGQAPFAITSPTSILLPTPETNDPYWKGILVEGTYPVFSKTRELIGRDKNFVRYIYRLVQAIKSRNKDLPSPIKPMADYLEKQYQDLHKVDAALYNDIEAFWNRENSAPDLSETYDLISDTTTAAIGVYGVPLGRLSKRDASTEVSKSSDLIISPTKEGAEGRPLVLSTNIPEGSELRYTSETNFWNSKDSKLDYSDSQLKNTPIEDRTTLPNGTPYPQGFIYDHDFLSDYIIRLPYKFNKEIFFNGDVNDEDVDEGFIPPVTEKYFDYFTIADLKKQMRINLKKAGGGVNGVEVFLSIPVKGGDKVIFKKSYTYVDQTIGQYHQIGKKNARGMIVDLTAAVAFFPNIRFSDPRYDHYLFQLARDSFSLPDFNIELEAVREEAHEEATVMKKAVRLQEEGIDSVIHFALNENEFSYLRLKLFNRQRTDNDSADVTAILIPTNFKDYDISKKRMGLTFGFDFGTSNTHVAVMTNGGDEDSKELKFELPVNQCVSTISNDALITPQVNSFLEYQEQLILPKGSQFGFPFSSVISKPRTTLIEESDGVEIPFLFSSIPFKYGKEDYGVTYNEILRNLKWNINKPDKLKYSKAFINELVFLAQVFAVNKDMSLSNSKITWSYPISMQKGLQHTLKTWWDEAAKKYFYQDEEVSTKVENFTESMAPMIYYKATQGDDLLGTVVSIDIGGGTSDIVVTPNASFKDSKLASIGIGGDNIFAIEDAKVSEVPMIKMAIDQISKKIESHKKSREDNRYESVLQELKKLKEGTEADATNVLFGLPFKKVVKDFSDEVNFNKWLVSRPAFHHIFHYYYASILFYLAELMKNNPDIFEYGPEKFFFSGAGSKILEIIIGNGNVESLRGFTEELFWFFLGEHEFSSPADDFSLKLERKEPKELTAKGCIISKGESLRRKILDSTTGVLQSSTAGGETKRKVGSRLHSMAKDNTQNSTTLMLQYKLLPSFDEANRKLKGKDISDEEVREEIIAGVKKFHESYKQFIEAAVKAELFYEDDDLDAFNQNFFVPDRKLASALEYYVRKDDLRNEEDEYRDVPFFLVIKRLIQLAVRPKRLAED